MSLVEIFLREELSLVPPQGNPFSSMFLGIEPVKEDLRSSGQPVMPIVDGLHGDLPAEIDTLLVDMSARAKHELEKPTYDYMLLYRFSLAFPPCFPRYSINNVATKSTRKRAVHFNLSDYF